MLRLLRVKNFGLMEDIALDLEAGLTVITGETGAGKSMIVSAVAALCGARIDDDAIRSGKKTAEITGVFDAKPSLRERLDGSGIAVENEIIIRRNIERGKRQSSYVNDRMVSLSFLRDIAREMVDLIGQHENQSLFEKRNHLALLDAYAGLDSMRNEYQKLYDGYRQLQGKLKMLLEQIEARDERIDLLRFQIDEIEKAGLQPKEEDDLNVERNLLLTSEKRALLVNALLNELYEQDGSAVEKLSSIGKSLEELAVLDSQLATCSGQIGDVLSTVDEIYRLISSYQSRIEFSQERLDHVIGRLETISQMKKKYGKSIEEIGGYLKRMKDELLMIETRDEEIEKTRESITEVESVVSRQADDLSIRRRKAAVDLEKEIIGLLRQLGMEKAAFRIRFTKTEATALGKDEVEFYISTNPGEDLKPLVKVASGGEISRITLCLKTILSDVDKIPTVIFDEVDIGIGGRIAEAVGDLLAKVSKNHQIVCVTHLPQIPTFADNHILVKKEIADQTTNTRVTKLDEASRKMEIARMLGGREITVKTREHAAEMLQKRKRK
ncbi:DNA repair protein RecN [candidate division WOR-3 bacterium]|nr:DNA repair protein RecN [candidate division WOR-3 bacterium]